MAQTTNPHCSFSHLYQVPLAFLWCCDHEQVKPDLGKEIVIKYLALNWEAISEIFLTMRHFYQFLQHHMRCQPNDFLFTYSVFKIDCMVSSFVKRGREKSRRTFFAYIKKNNVCLHKMPDGSRWYSFGFWQDGVML